MQLTTDSVLLGAWVWAEAAGGVTAGTTGAVAGTVVPQTVLDVGTGCGVLALMMAQRFEQAYPCFGYRRAVGIRGKGKRRSLSLAGTHPYC